LAGYDPWIRRSTRRLSVDVMATHSTSSFRFAYDIPPMDNILTFDAPNLETNTIDLLTLENYHDSCSAHLGQSHDILTPAQEPGKLGAILSFSSELAEWVEIASLPEPEVQSSWMADSNVAGEMSICGLTRYFPHLSWCKFVLTLL
jgi:hypothetical protein